MLLTYMVEQLGVLLRLLARFRIGAVPVSLAQARLDLGELGLVELEADAVADGALTGVRGRPVWCNLGIASSSMRV